MPELILKLAQENGVDIGASDHDELCRKLRFDDFQSFLMLFGELTFVLAKPDDFRAAVLSYAAQAARDGVVYAELTVTLGTHVHFKGLDPLQILEALGQGAAEAEDQFAIMIRYVLDHVRSFPQERFDETVHWCMMGRPYGVVGLGLGGPEAGWPASTYDSGLRRAADLGIPFVPHAGEAAGAESVWDAIRYNPPRIGHGLAAQSDERLIRQLANDRVMIELCPTSNLLLGHVSDLKDHPARRFFDAGIPITFNTDDPGIFRTSLLEEYEVAVHTLGFSLDDLAEISRKASEFALVDEVDVRSLKGQNLRAI